MRRARPPRSRAPHPHITMRFTILRLLTVLLVAAAAVLVVPGAARAASDSVTWSVQPASADGQVEPGAWEELTLDAGTVVQRTMKVTNHSDQGVHFSLSAADGYFTETGRFNMLPADRPSVDAGTWIALPDSVEVAAGASALVPYTVTVPANATPGDHPAGVAAGIFSEQASVGVESRIGFRVMVRVAGALAPALQSTVTSSYVPSWNPFLPGALEIRVSTTNTGNVRLAGERTLTVSGIAGLDARVTGLESLAELAPGESRETSRTIEGVWPLFSTTATVVTDASSVVEGTPAFRDSATTSVATVPWAQAAVVVAAAAIVLLMFRDRRRRQRRHAREIEDAREEGRRSAVASALAVVAIIVAGVIASVGAAAPAVAATPVEISVEVTPAPGGTLAPTPPGEVEEPPGEVEEEGAGTDRHLARTGGAVDPILVAGGILIMGAGAIVCGVSAFRRPPGRRRSARG